MGANKIVAVSGATGFVGGRLTQWLTACGYTIVPLGRALFSGNGDELQKTIAACDAVINLSGAPLNRRWTEKYQQELYDSRIIVTRKIVQAINATDRVKVLISTSAVGYYPSEGCFDETLKECDQTFLGQLCQAWEAEARKVKPSVRLAITRFGVVLAPDGGAFRLMTTPARMGVSVIFGRPDEGFAWIDREDLVRATEFILKNDGLSGVFNYVAPRMITQRDFSQAVAKRYKSLLTVYVPEFFFCALFGESAEFITRGQCVTPVRLPEAGFTFATPDIETFLWSFPN